MKKKSAWMWLFILVLTLIKLWLVEGQLLTGIANSPYDDRLFLERARDILQGHWMGSYDQMTLIKGPFYPLWIAFSFLLGIPLLLSQHLLYIAACITFAVAVRPMLGRTTSFLFLYVILLFNPVSFTTGVMDRVIRAGIYPALALLVIAFAVGLFLRWNESWRRLWVWSLGLGVSLAAFWLTREEGIWMLPPIFIICAGLILRNWRTQSQDWKALLMPWGISFSLWLILIGAVALLNQHHYGVLAKTEFDSRDYKAAYGALTHVKPEKWLPRVPVSQQTRRKIYKVSPAFSELKPFLEGDIGKMWLKTGEINADNIREIRGGWFMWALRDAVAAAGYYSYGKFPGDYYRRLADEINSACQEKEIDCYPERTSMMPPWDDRYFKPLLLSMYRGALMMVKFQPFSPYSSRRFGSSLGLSIYSDLTRDSLALPRKHLVVYGWAMKDGHPLSYRVVNATGGLVDGTVEFRTSRDAARYFSSQELDAPLAFESGFMIVTLCTTGCDLEIVDGGEALKKLPLSAGLETGQVVVDGDFYLFINKAFHVHEAELQDQTNAIKLNLLARIAGFYQACIPWVSMLALGFYGYLGVQWIIKKTDPARFLILTALSVGFVSRVVIIALVDVTSFPAMGTQYLSPAAPLWLAFISLALIWLIEDWWARGMLSQRSPSSQQEYRD